MIGLKFLLVDDEDDFSDHLGPLLRGFGLEGFSRVTNAQSAVRAIEQEQPDVVLLNWHILENETSTGTASFRRDYSESVLRFALDFRAKHSIEMRVGLISAEPKPESGAPGSRPPLRVTDISAIYGETDFFLDKGTGPSSVYQRLETSDDQFKKFISAEVRYNPALVVNFRGKLASSVGVERLLMRLLHEFDSADVFPISSRGMSGAGVLRVVAFRGGEPAKNFLLKYHGDSVKVKRELDNYRNKVYDVLPAGSYSIYDERLGMRSDRGISGFLSSFLGEDSAQVKPLSDYCASGRGTPAKTVKLALDYMEPWSRELENPPIRPRMFQDLYFPINFVTGSQLSTAFDNSPLAAELTPLSSMGGGGPKINDPSQLFARLGDLRGTVTCPTRLCHGDLNCENVMVNFATGIPFLIDFAGVRMMPRYWDHIELESTLKHRFMNGTPADAVELERVMLEEPYFKTPPPSNSGKRALTPLLASLCQTIRHHALGDRAVYAAHCEYVFGLVYYTLIYAKYDSRKPEETQSLIRALASATSLVDWLEAQ
ncbi:MAG: phosphotransferase [Thermoplasmata archaeon]|nr:phosphotransferase [Thermoplasmata archaeon]